MTSKLLVQVDIDLKDLIPNFLANRAKETRSLDEALSKNDFEAIRIIGHNMKGVGGGYGFNAITELGFEIENAAKGQDGASVRECLKRYRLYLESVDVIYV